MNFMIEFWTCNHVISRAVQIFNTCEHRKSISIMNCLDLLELLYMYCSIIPSVLTSDQLILKSFYPHISYEAKGRSDGNIPHANKRRIQYLRLPQTRQRIGVMKSNTYTFYSTRLNAKNVQLSRSAIKIHKTSTKVLLQDFLSKYKLMWSHANYAQPRLILEVSLSFQSLTEKVKNFSTNLHAGPDIFIPKLAICHGNGKYKGFYKQIFTKVLMKRSIIFNMKMEWKIFSGLPHSHQDKILCVFPMFLAFPLWFLSTKKIKIF